MSLESSPNSSRRFPTFWAFTAGGLLAAGAVVVGLGQVAADDPKPIARAVPPAVAVVPPAAPVDLDEINRKMEDAIRRGDNEEFRKQMELLRGKLLQPRVLGRPGAGFGGFAPFAAQPAQPAVDPLREEMEKTLKGLEESMEKLKNDPEGREQLQKTIDQYRKGLDEYLKNNPAPAQPAQGARDGKRDPKRLVDPVAPRGVPVPDPAQGLVDELQNLDTALRALQALQGGNDADNLMGLPGVFDMAGLFAMQGRDGGRDPFGGLPGFPGAGRGGPQPAPRFGIAFGPIPEALADQLDLPRGQGLLVINVVPGSAADKVGIKKNDVLVSFAGKDVPTDPAAFSAHIAQVKDGEKVNLALFRKGKKVEVKDVELPEQPRPAVRGRDGGRDGARVPRVTFEKMAVQVRNDDFDIDASKGDTRYVVAGKVEAGRPTANKIEITEGKQNPVTYKTTGEVPEAHRAAVTQLLGSVGGGR
ncbi:S1C family serine protease [Fimbriiglobus ruber]|uniref:PDZ domain-containing protein n=1 Tax=Fimbriiglobus ruber TaxID=1908690 RepID=A0A225DLW3_9BACT|nr:PDZ domain-containing protein [Fimbriiglobus ruber]OWK38199.1 hypothetical protein FRUB_07319 [Fimbriiglobus ruber]